jgi:plastocyanin
MGAVFGTDSFAIASGTLRAMRRLAGSVVAVSCMVAAGCGSNGAVEGDTVTITGVDTPLSFEPKTVEVDAGAYRVVFRNDGQLPHQLAIGSPNSKGEYPDGDTGQVAGGQTDSFRTSLDAGRYTFACYVDRHNEAGMVGTLVVR